MRKLLSVICLLFTFSLTAQNQDRLPAPLPKDEKMHTPVFQGDLPDQFSRGNSGIKAPNFRLASPSRSTANEGDRLVYDSLIWEVYDEEKDAWELSGKWAYEYDDRGFQSARHTYFWKDKWFLDRKYETTYHDNGKLLLSQSFSWDDSNNSWTGIVKTEQSYNENDDLTSLIHYNEYDVNSNSWTPTSKIDFEYDESNRNITETAYQWSESKWQSPQRKEYTYSPEGMKVLSETYEWSLANEEFYLLSRVIFEYDDLLNLHLTTTYFLDQTEGILVNTFKNEFQYDSNGNQIQEVTYVWDEDMEIWTKSRKKIDEYDNQNKITLAESYIWDEELTSWVGTFKANIIYSISGKRETVNYFDWSEKGEWVFEKKYQYLYNESDRLAQYEIFTWLSEKDEWKHIEVGEYYYSVYTLEVEDIAISKNFLLYPNPVETSFSLITESFVKARVSLVDLTGRKVREFDSAHEKYYIQELKAGVYNLIVTIKGKSEVIRLVKK